MTFSEPASISSDVDPHVAGRSSQTTLNIKLSGVYTDLAGIVTLTRRAVKTLDQVVDAVSGLAASLGWTIRSIELIDGCATIRFDPPTVGDLFSSGWTEAEFVDRLRSLIAETSAQISDRAAGIPVFTEPRAESPPSIGGQKEKVQHRREAAIGKLVRASVEIVVQPHDEGETVALPRKQDLPRVIRAELTAVEATVELEAISRDNSTGYDRLGRPIDLRSVQSPRGLQVGDKLTGPFVPLPRRPSPTLCPKTGSNFICQSVDGEEFTVDTSQLLLFRP